MGHPYAHFRPCHSGMQLSCCLHVSWSATPAFSGRLYSTMLMAAAACRRVAFCRGSARRPPLDVNKDDGAVSARSTQSQGIGALSYTMAHVCQKYFLIRCFNNKIVIKFVFDDSFMISIPGLILSNEMIQTKTASHFRIMTSVIGRWKGQILGQTNIS